MSNLPPNERPIYVQVSKSNPTIIILIVLLVCSVPAMGILAGLLLPAIQQAREAARRMNCSSNIRQIGIALMGYEYAYKSLPPAYTVDSDGNKLHSWRTLILPFLEQQALYSQIDLTKPWNDPVNARFTETAIPTYSCPSLPIAKNQTTYKVVVDLRSAFPGANGRLLSEIKDGTSNTLLVFESDIGSAVHWMEPEDSTMAEFISQGKSLQSKTAHYGGSNVLMADCAVQFISNATDAKTKESLVTADGGEPRTNAVLDF